MFKYIENLKDLFNTYIFYLDFIKLYDFIFEKV